MITPTLSLERRPDGVFSAIEQQALLGFLGGYSGLTRDAYGLDLRQFASWCQQRQLALFDVARHDIEGFARHLEELGRARATISRRLCTITSLYRYAVEEGLLDRSPAVHVRRPRLDYESNATGLDRNEVGAMMVAAGLAGARDHALISLLALNGLSVSEAVGADIERLGLERGHRTLLVHRKGGKHVTHPTRAQNCACGRSGRRRTSRGANLPRPRWPTTRSSRRLTDRAAHRPPRRHLQASWTTHTAPRVHHRRLGRRCPLTRRPRSRQPCRSAYHHALRPGARLA